LRPAAPATATVFTHSRPHETADALEALIAVAHRSGTELRFSPEETRKHRLEPREGLVLDAPASSEVDLCLALGGDGTILRALRAYVGTRVPVFSINFGEVGFLATLEPAEVKDGLRRAFQGEFDVLRLPGLSIEGSCGRHTAINDVSVHRRQGGRVAQLSYRVGDDELGRVRCDGLVVATPAGSTGYNLANNGPVLAWGVEGYVVSFIAPHSLTARALVAAPHDVLVVENRSRDEPVDVSVDGQEVGCLDAGSGFEVRFADDRCCLAQTPGASFYHRLREKFGKLSR
jgi:NAD+ kinase